MSTGAFEFSQWSKYMAMSAMAGRLIDYDSLSAGNKDAVDRAFAAVNKELEKRKADIRYRRSSPGAYAAFEYTEPRPAPDATPHEDQ